MSKAEWQKFLKMAGGGHTVIVYVLDGHIVLHRTADCRPAPFEYNMVGTYSHSIKREELEEDIAHVEG